MLWSSLEINRNQNRKQFFLDKFGIENQLGAKKFLPWNEFHFISDNNLGAQSIGSQVTILSFANKL